MADERGARNDATATRSLGAWLLVAAVLAAMTIALGVVPTRDPDLPWHLAIGARALETRSTLPVDPYSALYAGQPWRHKDLLADVLLQLTVRALGLRGLVVLDLLAVAAASLGVALALDRARRAPTAVLVGVGLATCASWFPQRPALFSWAIFPALIGLLAVARRRLLEARHARAMARALVPPLLLEWLWVQLHRAAPIGFLLFSALAAQLALARLARGRPRLRALFGPAPARDRAIVAAALATAAAPAVALVNPEGIHYLTSSLTNAGDEVWRRVITEYRPLPIDAMLRLQPVAAAVAGLAVVLVSARLLLALRRAHDAPSVDLFDLALPVALLAAVATNARWLPFLAFVAAIALARLFGELAAPLGPSARGAAAASMVILLVALARRGEGPFTVAMDPDRYPIGAMEFAEQHALRGPIVNPLALGGYALFAGWPEVRVLVDGRTDQLYPQQFVLRTIRAHKHLDAFEELWRQSGASWVLAGNAPGEVTHKFLARDPRFWLVFWSESATVYVERRSHPDLQPFAYRFVDDPDGLDVGVRRAVRESRADPSIAPALLAELRRMIVASPDSVRARGALCFALTLLGPGYVEERDRELQRLRELAPDSPVVRQLEAMRQGGR